jgi:ADP-dependent NAD(P)H-hydrate dehydratase
MSDEQAGNLKRIANVPRLVARQANSHKGSFGTVIVVGGCAEMIGAPALAARAAFRSGAGLVKIATGQQWLHAVLSIEPSATGLALDDADVNAAMARIGRADERSKSVLAIGPGWGKGAWQSAMLDSLIDGHRAIVLDADGLNALSSLERLHARSQRKIGGTSEAGAWECVVTPQKQKQTQTAPSRPGLVEGSENGFDGTSGGGGNSGGMVLTPHPGEFARLAAMAGLRESATDPATRVQAAAALARASGTVVVLKGHGTVVSDGVRFYVNDTGNAALATAGTGDVLTGLIASLIAQGLNEFDAAVLGVWAHGAAADRWVADRHATAGLLARELADELPAVLFG